MKKLNLVLFCVLLLACEIICFQQIVKNQAVSSVAVPSNQNAPSASQRDSIEDDAIAIYENLITCSNIDEKISDLGPSLNEERDELVDHVPEPTAEPHHEITKTMTQKPKTDSVKGSTEFLIVSAVFSGGILLFLIRSLFCIGTREELATNDPNIGSSYEIMSPTSTELLSPNIETQKWSKVWKSPDVQWTLFLERLRNQNSPGP